MDKSTPSLNLRDIHLPDDPSIWPLAFGWWLVIIVAAIICYFAFRKIKQLRKQNQLIYLMQDELALINTGFKKHESKHQLAVEVSALLKRFVRHVLNDNEATSLSGSKWIAYLNKQSNSEVFSPFISELTQAQYQPQSDFDAPRLMATVKNYFPCVIKSNVKKIQGSNHA